MKKKMSLVLAFVMCLVMLQGSAIAMYNAPLYDYMYFSDVSEGLFPCSSTSFMDMAGSEISLPNGWAFTRNPEFQEGVAVVIKQSDINEYGHTAGDGPFTYGVIDKDGKLIFQVQAQNLLGYSEGLAKIIIDGKVGFIDKSGNIAISAQYDAEDTTKAGFIGGLATVSKDGKQGLIDKTGAVVFSFQYDEIYCYEGIVYAYPSSDSNGYKMMDLSGNTVFNNQYFALRPLPSDPRRYSFSEGLACVEKISGGSCVINTAGEVVFDIPDTLWPVTAFHNERAVIMEEIENSQGQYLESLYHVYDAAGNKVFTLPRGASIGVWGTYIGYQDGLLLVSLSSSEWVYYDVSGNVVLTVSTENDGIDITPFFNGHAVYWDSYNFHVLKNPLIIPTSESPSDWAIEEINAAIEAGLVPEHIQKNYTQPVSRGNVAQMYINFIEKYSGQSIDEFLVQKGVSINADAFTDTNDKAVLAANALGIIEGVGNGKFEPEGTFTRAHVAAILNRIASVLGIDTAGYTHSFTDVVGHWVDAELGWPVHVGIIKGVGGNRFEPDTYLTTEQVIAATYRAFRVYTVTPNPPPVIVDPPISETAEAALRTRLDIESYAESRGYTTTSFSTSDIIINDSTHMSLSSMSLSNDIYALVLRYTNATWPNYAIFDYHLYAHDSPDDIIKRDYSGTVKIEEIFALLDEYST